MSTHDDVRVDLANHPGLTRAQMEQVVTLLDRAAAGKSEIAVTVALRSLLPEASKRLASASATEVAEYRRVLKGVMTVRLQR